LAGSGVATALAFSPARLFTRRFYSALQSANGRWNVEVPIDDGVIEEMQWWLTSLDRFNGKSLLRPIITAVLLTDASLLHKPKVQQALTVMDAHQCEVWAKLDAGSEAYFKRICRTEVPFLTVLRNIQQTAKVRPVVIQSLFVDFQDDGGPTPLELKSYVQRIREFQKNKAKISLVQIYTVARQPAVVTVRALPLISLRAIGEKVRKATKLSVEICPGDWGLRGD